MITLHDAISLLSKYRREVAELQRKRERIAVVKIEATDNWEDYLNPEDRVEIINDRIDAVIAEYHKLGMLVRDGNSTKITMENSQKKVVIGEKGESDHADSDLGLMSVADRIELAKMYRAESKMCVALGNKNKRSRESGYERNGNLINQTTYDIKAMAERGLKFQKMAEDLSKSIDSIDTNIVLDFEDKIFS